MGRIQRLTSIGLLGFSSGLPLALTASTLQAWLTVSGVEIMLLSFASWVGQPYVYRFLWAPCLDRWSLWPRVGLRRSWLLATQAGCALTIFAVAQMDPSLHPFRVMGLSFVLAMFSATQDIAVDGFRIVLLPEAERALGMAFYSVGYRMGMLISGALALVLAEQYSWFFAYNTMGCLMVLGFVTTCFIREPGGLSPFFKPISSGFWGGLKLFWQPVQKLWEHPYFHVFLGIALTYKLADAFALSLSATFLIKGAGYTVTQVGLANKAVGILAGISGAMLGGWLMLRSDLWRALMLLGVLQALSGLAFAALLFQEQPRWLPLLGAVAVEHGVSGMGSVAFVAFLTSLCDKKFAAAQYTFWSAVAMVGRVYVGPLAGWVAEHYGWLAYFGVSVLCAIPAMILLWWIRDQIAGDDWRNFGVQGA